MGVIFSKKKRRKCNAKATFTSIFEETTHSTASVKDLRGCHRNSMFTVNQPQHIINVKKNQRAKVSFPNLNSKYINILIIASGVGRIPAKHDVVEIEYIGYLGDKVDESNRFIKHRGFINLGYQTNITGLELALRKMTVGSVVQLWIPSVLGYGANGCKIVPANTNLFFNLKLIRIY